MAFRAILCTLLFALAACAAEAETERPATPLRSSGPAATTGPTSPPVELPRNDRIEREPLPAGLQIAQIAGGEQGLIFPVALAFLPDGRWLVTEKGSGGDNQSVVHLFSANGQTSSPFVTLDVNSTFERGLLGVAVDPAFVENHFVYLHYTSVEPVVHTTVRYLERDGAGVEPVVVFSAPLTTGAGNHNGGNIHFGPEGKLYITVGENASPGLARDPLGPYGKIHRINPDGSIPADNPFGAVSTWAYGLRNSFDFGFDPQTGALWASENGPSCDDELNLIRAGGDYGWGPGVGCGEVAEGSTAPAVRWSDTDALTGVLVVPTGLIPAWDASVLVCGYSSGSLYRAQLNAQRSGVTRVTRVELPAGVECRADLELAPDGSIYLVGRPEVYRISVK